MVAHSPVVYAGSETEIWTNSADYVVFSGDLDQFDVKLLRNGASCDWIVTRDDGVTYQIAEATSLKFDNKVITSAGVYLVEEVDTIILGNAGAALALVQSGVFGLDRVNDEALLGEVIAYIKSMGIKGVLQRLIDDSYLPGIQGASPHAIVETVLSNILGRKPDATTIERVSASIEEISSSIDGREASPEVAAIVAALYSDSAKGKLLQQQEFNSIQYERFEDPILATESVDYVFADMLGGTYELGGGRDTVDLGYYYLHDFDIHGRDGAIYVLNDDGVEWVFRNAENLSFYATMHAFDMDGNAGIAARLLGVGFGNVEQIFQYENHGLVSRVIEGIEEFGIGVYLERLVQSGEVAAIAGGNEIGSLVSLLYKNITGTPPSQADVDWTVDWMNAQGWGEAEVIRYAMELPQTDELIDIEGLATQGLYLYGWGVPA